MNKRFAGLLLAVILTCSVFAGCGAAKSGNSAANLSVTTTQQATAKDSIYDGEAAPEETQAGAMSDVDTAGEEQKSVEGVNSIGGGGSAGQSVSNAILSERKVIRSANVTVEVENFDEAYSKLDTLILGIGFIQSTNINTEKYFADNEQKLLRHGSIVIRVDKEKFDKVLNSIKGIGEVLSWNINGEDVTDKFFDTESRLRLLRIEEGKLEEYLKKLNDLDQIFKTESRLTDIRYQIESLTGNLKKMGDLVDLSTISITMNEKRPGADEPVKPLTYWEKLLNNFLYSIKGVANFIGELVIVLVAATPILILIGLFVLIAILIYRKIPKKRMRAGNSSTMTSQEKSGNNEKNQ